MSLPAKNVDVTTERDQLGMSWSRNPGHVAHRDDISQARGGRAAQAPRGDALGALRTLTSPCEGWGTSGSGLLLQAPPSRVGRAVEEEPLVQRRGQHVVKWGSWHGWAYPYREVFKGGRESGDGRGLRFRFLTSSRYLHRAQQQIRQEDTEGPSRGALSRRKREGRPPPRDSEGRPTAAGEHPVGRGGPERARDKRQV